MKLCGEMVSMHERDSTNDKPCVLQGGHDGPCGPTHQGVDRAALIGLLCAQAEALANHGCMNGAMHDSAQRLYYRVTGTPKRDDGYHPVVVDGAFDKMEFDRRPYWRPGDLVMESSTVWFSERHLSRVGFVISDGEEWLHTDEDWSADAELREEWGNQRPRERITRIRLLWDGSEFAWTNARFVRLFESVAATELYKALLQEVAK